MKHRYSLFDKHNENLYSLIIQYFYSYKKAIQYAEKYCKEDEDDQTLALCTDGLITHIIEYDGTDISIKELPENEQFPLERQTCH
jgi:hypothetical protein